MVEWRTNRRTRTRFPTVEEEVSRNLQLHTAQEYDAMWKDIDLFWDTPVEVVTEYLKDYNFFLDGSEVGREPSTAYYHYTNPISRRQVVVFTRDGKFEKVARSVTLKGRRK